MALNELAEQIRLANEAIKPMEMKRQNKRTGEVTSKFYAEVNQRVKAFRMVYPNGRIKTSYREMLGDPGDRRVLIHAEVFDGNGNLLATGTAEEWEKASQINATSFIENCETSAIGRALGFCGFGIDASIASLEEVSNAIAQQEQKEEKVDAKQVADLRSQMYAEKMPWQTINQKQIDWILKNFQLGHKEDITMDHIEQATKLAREKKNGK